jgi:hypothetical protein
MSAGVFRWAGRRLVVVGGSASCAAGRRSKAGGASLVRAAVVGEPAARGEDAAGERLTGRRQEARDRVQPPVVLALAAPGDAAQQPDGVGVAGLVEDLAGPALLDELAGVEDADAVAHLGDHGEVVADEQHRGVELAAQAATRSSTSASTVASSAVVGSSRISSDGSEASAMAITDRCSIPPESWCG